MDNFVDGNVNGPDVSFYQDDNTTPQQIDFTKMVGQGASFVIIRAGQNLWIDPDFSYNWIKAAEAGLPRGAYWFYDSRVSPETQAELFAERFTLDPPELELWADLEENYGGAYSGYVYWKRFLNRLKQLLPNAHIGIYTSYGYFYNKIPLAEYSYFASFPLWLANYNPLLYVKIPPPWTKCLYWQWGTPAWGIAWGCESLEIDMNKFNGTLDEFKARYNLGGTIPPPGGNVDYYYILHPAISGNYVSVRETTTVAHILGSKIGQINAGSSGKGVPADRFEYLEDVYVGGILRAKRGDIWHHVYEANGIAIDGWSAEIHLGVRYLNIETVGTPPSTGDIVVNATLKSDGTVVGTWTGQ